jgi:PAN domain
MRLIVSFRLIVLTSLISMLAASPSWAQVGFDRPGGDYSSFPVRTGDPVVCALRCEHEARCRAWAFSYPHGEDAALCWLKAQVPARIEEPSSISGVRGAGVIEPRRGPTEFAIDRVGGDYKTIDLPPDPTGLTCKAACEGENRCRAWTYLRPGYAGPEARCFLKDKVKPPHHKPCCISGVVR